jgi:hypothetical protein
MTEPDERKEPELLPRIITPLDNAQLGAERTSQVVAEFRSIMNLAMALHVENGYVPKLRAIFRGSS